MMYPKKLTLIISALLLSQHAMAAKPVIEDRGLTNVKPLETQATKEWQMYERIQAQDAELSKLRDQVERLEAKLAQANKKASSRLDFIEKRLENQEAALLGNTTEATEDAADSSNTTNNPTTNTAEATADSDENPLTTPKKVDEDAAKKDYLAAYEVFKKSGAKAGIEKMDAFIQNHAGSLLIPSAHYWAGEFYLTEKTPDLGAAELRFATVVNRYPKDAKAPRALYRLANLADAEGKTSAAKAYMNKLVKNYPETEQAKLAQDYLSKNK